MDYENKNPYENYNVDENSKNEIKVEEAKPADDIFTSGSGDSEKVAPNREENVNTSSASTNPYGNPYSGYGSNPYGAHESNPYKHYNTNPYASNASGVNNSNPNPKDSEKKDTYYENPYHNNKYNPTNNNNYNQNPYVNHHCADDSCSSANNNYNMGNNGGGYNRNPYDDQNPYVAYNNMGGDKGGNGGKGMAIASMVLGIVSVTICCCSVIGLVTSIVGLILGIIAQKNQKSGFALAGIITSAFGIAFGLLSFAVMPAFWEEFMKGLESALESYSDYSFDNNNNAFIGLFNILKRFLGL